MFTELQEEIKDEPDRIKYQEAIDRVMAVYHIQTEHFQDHVKIEGHHEGMNEGSMFQCDRLMKAESIFGRLQFGYNPNRRRSFVFATVKSSRYDSVNGSSHQVMKEYQRDSGKMGLKKSFASRSKSQSAVLFENAAVKPWREEAIYSCCHRLNTEVLAKAMPYLHRNQDKKRLAEVMEERKQLQKEIQQNMNEGNFRENVLLRSKQNQKLMEENVLNHLLCCKESASRYFLGRLNGVFDAQKHKMFEYYKNLKQEEAPRPEAVNASGEDDTQEDLQS